MQVTSQAGQDLPVDITAIPTLEGFASIVKEWPSDVNPAFGKQYQVLSPPFPKMLLLCPN